MADAELTLPLPIDAAWATDLDAIERWADEQRAELLRLADELRALQTRIDAAQSFDATTTVAAPVELLPVVDGMLRAAMERLDAGVAAARAAADALVESAMGDARTILEAAGAGESVVARLTERSPRVEHDLRRPRSATALWDDLVESAGPAPTDVSPPSPASASVPPLTPAAAPRVDAPSGGGPTTGALPGFPDLVALQPASLGAGMRSDPAPGLGSMDPIGPLADQRAWGPAQLHVNDQFWAVPPSDQPVRERLRRFAQRSPQ